MRSIIFVVLSLLLCNHAVSQTKSFAQLKKEGDWAFEKKDFASALSFYEQAIETDFKTTDGQLYFNAAHCARKIKNNIKAISYYPKAEELNYNADISCFYNAFCFYDLGKGGEAKEILLVGIEKYTNSNFHVQMKHLLANVYVDEGSKLLNDGLELINSDSYKKAKNQDKLNAKSQAKFIEAKSLFEKAAQHNASNERIQPSLIEVEKLIKPIA